MDLRVLEQTFALFDKNNSKRISVKDMGDFLRLMGEDVTEDEVREMIQGVSGEDGINFEQFARFMQEDEEEEVPTPKPEPEKKKKVIKKKVPELKMKSPRPVSRKRSKSTVSTTSSKIMNFLSPRSKKTSEKKTTPRKRSNSITSSSSECPSDRSVDEMHRAFQAFDLNGDGKVTTHEVGIMMRRFGLGSQEQSIQNLFDLLGPSEQGKRTEEIDFAQFLRLTNMV